MDEDVVITSIRTPEEAEAFRRLNEEWIVDLFVLEDADRAVLEDPFGTIVDQGGDVLVANRDGRTVGCVALLAERPGVYELTKMAVDVGERGRGTGRKLALAAIERARELRASSLFLASNKRLAPAVALYESIGFVHVPPEQLSPVPYTRADVFMLLDLRA